MRYFVGRLEFGHITTVGHTYETIGGERVAVTSQAGCLCKWESRRFTAKDGDHETLARSAAYVHRFAARSEQ